MLERFTPAARQVVVQAQEEALALGHPWLGTEHLLLGVLAFPDAVGVKALAELGVTLEAARGMLTKLVGRGGVPDIDADALRSLGIDLDVVRRKVEERFGAGALDRAMPLQPKRRRVWRRRRCEETLPNGRLPFMPRAKRALERALREALALDDGHIGVEHILLGLLDPKGNMALDLLRGLGTDPEVVRNRVLTELGKAA